ncbi:glycosyltransferase [Microbulbifer sp. TRSA005]|uniref:glycosyltransferase n=1 Tax=unclassified Microbulbifer TaxID=2619833 RepID=UPI00403A3D0A
MDVLLKHAEMLSEHSLSRVYSSVPGRIAYIVSHGESYASNGYAVRTQEVAKSLNEQGFDTLCFVRPGRPWELGSLKNNVAPEIVIDGVRYIHSRWKKNQAPNDERDHLESSVARFCELFKIYRPEFVLAASDYIVGLPAWVAAKRHGIPFYYEVRGFWELSRAAREPGFDKTSLFKIEAERNTFVCKKATKVFTLNHLMRTELSVRGIEIEKINILPLGINRLPIKKHADPEVKKRLGIDPDDIVIGYIGSFNSYEGIDTLIEACKELNHRRAHYKLLLVGDENPTNQLVHSQRQLANKSWIIQVGRVEHEKVADYYALIDVIVIPRKKFLVSELVSPMKALESIAFGKRLVVSDVEPLLEISAKYDGVISFEAANVTSLRNGIQQVLSMPVSSNRIPSMNEQLSVLVNSLRERFTDNVENVSQSRPLIDVTELINTAKELIEQPIDTKIVPVNKCVAFVGSYNPDNVKEGYAKRIIKMAKLLQIRGYKIFCFIRSENRLDKGTSSELYKRELTIDGISHILYDEVGNRYVKNNKSYLQAEVDAYIEMFKIHRPSILIASGNFSTSLPAIISARKVSLPVIKEHLFYADAFIDESTCSYYSNINFTDKYRIERTCEEFSDYSYYLFPNDPDNRDAFLKLINRIEGSSNYNDPIKVLSPKTIFTISQTIDSSGLYYLELEVNDETGGNSKGIVASFRFFDKSGKQLKGKISGFAASKAYPHYQYVDTTKEKGALRLLIFTIPENSNYSKVEADIVAFSTIGKIQIQKANLGKVRVEDTARWLSQKMPGTHWVKAIEPFIHKEGATSLRLALLSYKYNVSGHKNDLNQLNSAIQEMVELDRTWVPNLIQNDRILKIRKNEKLTVAHLHKTAYPYENTGGAIRCLNTVLSQQRIGIDPFIISPVGYPRSAGISGVRNYEKIEGIEHFRIGANTEGLRGISLADRSSYSAFHIAMILKARGAHLIHAASGVRGYELALQALAIKRATGLPLLYEVRSFHEHTWTSVRGDVMELEKTKLRIIKEDFCMSQADFVTTISYSMKKILIERGVAPEKIGVIPNAIDETKYLGKKFKPVEIPELQGADYVVGYISNMSRREGHQYLIRAIKRLREISGLNIRGLLVGDGPERQNLQDLADQLELSGIIHFSGEVDHSLINSYYKAIDLFVIPRIPDYAADWVTPLKPYEAMALERPIIVTDLPALKEVVGENGDRGLIAKPADVNSLVDQLLIYINDPALRQNKVKIAKDWVFSERTWSANAIRYETIYKGLVTQVNMIKEEVLHA